MRAEADGSHDACTNHDYGSLVFYGLYHQLARELEDLRLVLAALERNMQGPNSAYR